MIARCGQCGKICTGSSRYVGDDIENLRKSWENLDGLMYINSYKARKLSSPVEESEHLSRQCLSLAQ